jgi:hypothetical protein
VLEAANAGIKTLDEDKLKGIAFYRKYTLNDVDFVDRAWFR